MPRRLIMLAALAAFLLALPAGALAATKPVPVNLAGVLFNNKENPKVTLKLGGSLRFVWKDGFHNVLTSKAPAKANKVNSGNPSDDHKPIVFKPAKKGKYVFYCVPHKSLGMVLTLTVT
jgi:plastocyanin